MAGTSRGVMHQHVSYSLRISQHDIVGVGEAAPLPGLSIDALPEFELILQQTIEALQSNIPIDLTAFPSIAFALETAQKDLENGGRKLIFDNQFYNNQTPIAINGLVWMDTKDNMQTQIDEKISQGFDTIKIKIGAIDFDQEIALLKYIRSRYTASEIAIRVDANGAFAPNDALEKIKKLSDYELHSIEQPIKAGQWDAMAQLCQTTPLPIALDEELIGINTSSEKLKLLQTIKPDFIILKPTLLGGFAQTHEWIQLAEAQNMGWWATSALESNIGLNAICQFVAQYHNPIKQGLGTGGLYQNNIESPLCVQRGHIFYDKTKSWGESR